MASADAEGHHTLAGLTSVMRVHHNGGEAVGTTDGGFPNGVRALKRCIVIHNYI